MGACDIDDSIPSPPQNDMSEPVHVKSPTDQPAQSLGFAAAYRYRDAASLSRPTTTISPDGIGEELDSSIDEPAYQDYKWKYSGYGSCTPSCGFGK